MRRNNFWVGALVALLTFVALSAFIGRRPWYGRCRLHNDGYYHEQGHPRSHWENDRQQDQEKQPLTDTITSQ